MHWSSYFSLFTPHHPSRLGIHVEPGCRLVATSGFLPDWVVHGCGEGYGGIGRVLDVVERFVDPCVWAEWGPLWYAGDLGEGTGSRVSHFSTIPYSSHRHGWRHTSTTHRRYTGVLSTGSVYTPRPWTEEP
jgi:hypothetical protein